MDVFELTAKLTLDTSEYDKALKGAGSSLGSVGTAATGAGKKISMFGDLLKANLASNAITAGVKGVVNTIGAIGGAVLDVGKSVANLAIGGGMERALNTEAATFKLKGLHMEADQVTEVMNNAKAAATDTAYGLDEMATVAASAVAAGVKPGAELTRTLSLVGDAAAIAGRDIGSMGAIFNKIAASGKMQGDEINQLTDAGIPILQLLGDVLNTDAEGVRALAKAGEIGFDEFQLAIEKGMGGAALEMGNTFSGGLANLQASIKRIGESIMTPFLNEMTPAMTNLKKIFNAMNGDMTVDVQQNIEELKQHVTTGISGLITNVGNLLHTMIPVFTEVLTGLAPLISDSISQIIPLITDLLPELVSSGLQIIEAIGRGIIESAPNLLNAVMEIGSSLGETINQLLEQAIDFISNFDWAGAAQNLITGLQSMFAEGGAIDTFAQNAIQLVEALATGLGEAAPVLIPGITALIAQFGQFIVEQIPGIYEAAANLALGLAEGLCAPGALSPIINAAVAIIVALQTAIIQNSPQLIMIAPRLVLALAQAIGESLDPLINSGTQMIETLINTITNELSKFVTAGAQLIQKFVEGIKSKFGELKNAAKSIVKTIEDEIKDKIKQATQWGKDLIGNFINGITSGLKTLRATASTIGSTIKSYVGHSHPDEGPMKDDYMWMPDMMKLFADGIRDNTHLVTDQLQKSFDFGNIVKSPLEETAEAGGSQTSQIVDLLTQIRDKGNVVIIEGDAGRMFRVMQSEAKKNGQLTGQEAFGW